MRKVSFFALTDILMVLLMPLISIAQVTLAGTITAIGKPLENASISVSNGVGSSADRAGNYTIKRQAGT